MENPTISRPSYPITPKNVAVLMGGWSPEREVSLSSGTNVCKALQNLGHQVFPIDPSQDLSVFVDQLKTAAGGKLPDVVFNILHGNPGEDGVIQGVLELMNLPYTFSNVLGSSLAMDKDKTRLIALSAGVQCPKGEVISLEAYQNHGVSYYPHVIKPLHEGSTVGIHFIETPQQAKDAVKDWHYGTSVLVEDYIPGQEVQVAVFGGTPIGAVKICFDSPIFSYDWKYSGKASYLIPAPIPAASYQKALEVAAKMHTLLGCQGVTRSDFRYDPQQESSHHGIFYLETNTQPGMTATSLVPKLAANIGWSYEDVIQWILEDGLCRKQNLANT